MTGKCPSPKNTAQSGFTLVEILMTLLIITIIVLGLTALQIATIRTVGYAKEAGEATRLAQLVLTRYKGVSLANLPSQPCFFGATPQWCTELMNDQATQMRYVDATGQGDGPFTVETMIQQIVNPPSFLISVRVSWLNKKSVPVGPPAMPTEANVVNVTLTIQRF
jgi:prepilin-type N-terminal cleavage/methylation domain-containing protein